MKELLILRHAKAENSSPDGRDQSRPLAARGVKSAHAMGKVLRRFDYLPEAILCSPATRAHETARLLAKAAELPPPRVIDAIYGEGAPGLRKILGQLPGSVDRAMLVGHNPTLEELVGSLCGAPGAPAHIQMDTGTLVVLEAAISSWKELDPGCASLLWILPPRLALAIDPKLETD